MRSLLLFLFVLIATAITGQNCGNTSFGNPVYIPVNDLGPGTWNGFMGGLYPNGSNFLPAAHKMAGLQLASRIQPLDRYGNPDPVNGKIVFISIGMSNTTMAFSVFIPMGNADPYKNPQVKLVDCAEGGMSSNVISLIDVNSYAHYWDTTVVNRLAAAGVTGKQVQVIWYKEAIPVGNPAASPQTYSDSLKIQSKRIMNILKFRFPNAGICYIVSRIYAGYATSALNPEPYGYWQGWSMKWLIEDQLNRDPMLQYSGTKPNSPWLCWGTYNWANGMLPAKDGLTWNCPADFNTDGTHPSVIGRKKVAERLLNFLDTDSTACWYRGDCQTITGFSEKKKNDPDGIVFPNPATGQINFSEILYDIEVFNSYGQPVRAKIKSATHISTQELPDGFYFIRTPKSILKFVVKH